MSIVKTIRSIYTTLIPEPLRKKLADERKRKKIIAYYEKNPPTDDEAEEALSFLRGNALNVFPYPFHLPYLRKPVTLDFDNTLDLPYVMHDGNRLYFKRSWSRKKIKKNYRILLAEQDKLSAHRYLTDDYTIESNSSVVDIGAAEGIFALSEMHKIHHLYLIETDAEWIETLNATYAPWKDKITIVEKYVSNIDDEKNVRLDTYFRNHETIDFIKIDVDGAEQELLNGADSFISNKIKRMVICTYHKPQDYDSFSAYLMSKSFDLTHSKGYMIFHYENFAPPYLRRGVIRAKKKD